MNGELPGNSLENILRGSNKAWWLVPDVDTEVYYRMQHTIDALAQEFNAPPFVPHVTLSGVGGGITTDEEMLALTAAIAARHTPFTLAFDQPAYEPIWNRAFYVRATRSPELLQLYADATASAPLESNPPLETYMPHTSFLYGAFPEDVKTELMRRFGNDFPRSMTFSQLHLFSNIGHVSAWHEIGHFPLGK